VAIDNESAMELVRAVEASAASAATSRLSVRCQTRHAPLYAALIADGFRVHWTDLRMTLSGREEQAPHGILLSNWEI